MGCLKIRLFGGLELSRNGQKVGPFPTRESEMIFSFLLLNRERLLRRESLFSHFYPDIPESTARKRLRNAIWRIRSVLEPTGVSSGTYISTRNREIGFNTQSDFWLDVGSFESNIARIPMDPKLRIVAEEATLISETIDLYRGRLLEGYCEDWCLWHQERSKLLLLSAIERLMQYFAERKDWASAILNAQHLLSHDALREHVYRDLMSFLYQIGDRPAALKQYAICARLLRAELGVEPMRATTNLRDAIEAESTLQFLTLNPPRKKASVFAKSSRKSADADLMPTDDAIGGLDAVRSSLRRAMTIVAQLIADEQHHKNADS